MQLKRTRLRTNLFVMNENGLQINAIKIDGITFREGAPTQQGFKT